MSVRLTFSDPVHLDLEVPPGLAEDFRKALLTLYEVAAETLHGTVQSWADHRTELSEVLAARERLTLLGAALDQVGWSWMFASDPIELTAQRDVILDGLKTALLDCRQHLGELWSSAGYRPQPPAGIGEATDRVEQLQALLAAHSSERVTATPRTVVST